LRDTSWPIIASKLQRLRAIGCLEQGLRLDLNKLRRQGLVGPEVGLNVIRWTYTYTGEEIAREG